MSQPPLPRLSVRRGLAQEDGPYEGVPDHLRSGLARWASECLGSEPVDDLYDDLDVNDCSQRERRIAKILAKCRVSSSPGAQLPSIVDLIVHRGAPGPGADEHFLDVVDMHLQLCGGGADELADLLEHGGSVWTVAKSPLRLERRAPEQQSALYDSAATPADEAAKQLTQAWSKVYGRHPDPSDAWDHAIKAVEVLLKPVVSPNNNQARYGVMLSNLKAKPAKWTFVLPTGSKTPTSVDVVIGMLGLLYPNPDRHPDGARNPTQPEAEAVIGLAVLLVSWLRGGALQLADPPL